MNDPWANRHPEWAQDEGAAITRAERAALRRLLLGIAIFAAVAIGAFVLAVRDQLPAGW